MKAIFIKGRMGGEEGGRGEKREKEVQNHSVGTDGTTST